MQFKEITTAEKQPFVQLLLLGLFVFLGMFIGQLIGLAIAAAIYGFELLTNLDWLTGKDLKYVGALKIILFASQLGTFLVPAFLLALIEKIKPAQFFELKKPSLYFLLLAFLIMIFATPLVSYFGELNSKMHFPSFLKGLEEWMRNLEDQGEETTKAILNMKTWKDMLLSLLLMAVIPAICEEFLFRGALQRILLKMNKNPHVAIWIGAIIFSAFHLQFFGFLPRMFLGAILGYLYFYTGSLWYSIFAHFLNNAFFVLVSYYYQLKHLPIDKTDQIPFYAAIISAILTLALFKFLKDKTDKSQPAV